MKNKKLLKKLVATSALLAMTVIPTIAWASSYTSTLSFNTTLKGKTRHYSGNDMGITTDCYTGSGYNSSGEFTVELYRDNLFTDDRIGSGQLLRSGSSSAYFMNVGSGDYYFYFKKANDGTYVYGDVSMYN